MTKLKKLGVLIAAVLAGIFLFYQVLQMSHQAAPVTLMTSGSLPTNQALYHTEGEEDEHEFDGKFRYKHTKRQLPQCLIIGARKAGTRALLTYLDMHPHVMAARREIHFFDDDENYSQGMEWYRKKMPYSFPGVLTIEKTPAYFVCDLAPERVKRMNSSMKLILIVRDPIDRAVSDYLQIRENKLAKNKPYETFDNLAVDHETGEVRREYNALKRSVYYHHMKHWLVHFPLEQFHIIKAEDLVSDPMNTLHSVETFLGLEHRITEDLFYFNKTRGFYCIRNETEQKCLAESKGRKHPVIDPFVRQKLQKFFLPFNRKFYNLVRRNFGWS